MVDSRIPTCQVELIDESTKDKYDMGWCFKATQIVSFCVLLWLRDVSEQQQRQCDYSVREALAAAGLSENSHTWSFLTWNRKLDAAHQSLSLIINVLCFVPAVFFTMCKCMHVCICSTDRITNCTPRRAQRK